MFYFFAFLLFSFFVVCTHTHTHTHTHTKPHPNRRQSCNFAFSREDTDATESDWACDKTSVRVLRSLHELKRHDLNQHSTVQRRCGASRAWTTSRRHLDLRMCEFYVCAYPGSIPLGFFCANGSFAVVFFSAHSFTCPSKDAFCIDEWCRSE